jgi:hypothetical protein
MAQAARTNTASTVRNRSPRQFAIARRIAIARQAAARQGQATSQIVHKDPALVQACMEAAGFVEHHNHM